MVLYMMGRARPQESKELVRKTKTAPRLVICSRLRGHNLAASDLSLATCGDWDLTMNLYLSTAMAMLVREDMYTATHGKVFTNLGRVRSNKIVYCTVLHRVCTSFTHSLLFIFSIRYKVS